MENQMFEFGGFRISAVTRTLKRDGVEIPLTGREFDTLWCFVRHPGVPLSWGALSQEVWKDANVSENNLRKQISSLRRKLGCGPDGNEFIRTISNQGYQLATKVVPIVEEEHDASPHPESGPPAPAPGPTFELPKPRYGTLPLSALGIATAIACSGAFAAWQFLPKEARVVEYRQITRDGRQKISRLFTDGKLIYFGELMDGKPKIASVPMAGGVIRYLPIPPAALDSLSLVRNSLLVQTVEDGQLAELDLGTLTLRRIPLPEGVGAGGDAVWDPDGRRIAIANRDALVVFEPWKAKKPLRLPVAGAVSVSAWHPTGRRLRFDVLDAKHSTTFWWDLIGADRTAHRLPPLSLNPNEGGGAWTADGQFFVFAAEGNGQPQIWIAEGTLGASPHSYQLTQDARIWASPTAVPGSDTIVALGGQSQGQLMTLSDSGYAAAGKAVPPGGSAYELDYSRDGQWIAYTLYPEHTIWRCRIDGSEPRQLSPPGLIAHQPHWSPDGAQIAFMGRKTGIGTRSRIYLVPSAGGNPVVPLPDGDDQGVPTWSPDGRSLFFGDLTTPTGFEHATIHSLGLQTRALSPVASPVGMWSPRMSPDGKYLAAISYDNQGLYIRDNSNDTWRKCAAMHFMEEPTWPPDSSWIQFIARQQGFDRVLFRVSPSCEQPRYVADLSSFEFIGDSWVGIAPDRSPMGLVRAPSEIFSLGWRLRRRF
jgi:Tol biopolymer transport system component/DNA-binding winged helix-turn-helix (wHTH) protein